MTSASVTNAAMPSATRKERADGFMAPRAERLLSRESELAQRVLAQLRLLYLAASGHADRLEVGDDPQITRHAEVGRARLAPGDELRLLRSLAGLERHIGRRHLAEARIRHPDHLRGLHRRMGEQHLLHLGGRDVLAADAEDVLQAADHAEAALGRDLAEIAGTEP